jgi:hypothetical protein
MDGRSLRRSILRRLLPALPVVAAALLFGYTQRPPRIPMPGLVLWAWERPEDLRFIDPASTGVAYLAATIGLQPDGTGRFHLRHQPLRVPPDTSLIAVVRIESPPRYVFGDPARIAAKLATISQKPEVKALQIDYDARASERQFYRALLAALRRKTRLPIGITALASWCDGDPWLNDQSVSEAVPMFFRMGPNESKNMPVRTPGCRDSIGLSTDEAWPARRPQGMRENARIYVFNPHPWTEVAYQAAIRHAKEWK